MYIYLHMYIYIYVYVYVYIYMYIYYINKPQQSWRLVNPVGKFGIQRYDSRLDLHVIDLRLDSQ